MSMRERQEIQEVLWRLSAANHAASGPGFDDGRVNEIRVYGTRGTTEPRAPRLSWQPRWSDIAVARPETTGFKKQRLPPLLGAAAGCGRLHIFQIT
jgi:hypothetical protein